jgi:opacity protein-like surface antigen
MNALLLAGAVALAPAQAFAQAPDTAPGTPTGHELNVSVGGYRYVEPLTNPISLSGAKLGGEYTGTWSLSEIRQWFFQADVRGLLGNVTYDGYCRPWLIRPNADSPNGWALGLGPEFPCSEGGNPDWYVEGRALAGKDFMGRSWGVSPYAGVGVRHLSSSIAGVAGYRTDDYLYLPVGVTTRTRVAARALSVTLEYDYLIHGWQTTRQSALGGGMVPATATAPAFTIDGFTDVSFDQPSGWGLRAGATYQVTPRWSVEPYYVRWSVDDSTVNTITATFTVNGVTARQQLGFYEPYNTTDEFGVKLGVRF